MPHCLFIESKCLFLHLFYKAQCIVKSKITACKISSFLTFFNFFQDQKDLFTLQKILFIDVG